MGHRSGEWGTSAASGVQVGQVAEIGELKNYQVGQVRRCLFIYPEGKWDKWGQVD